MTRRSWKSYLPGAALSAVALVCFGLYWFSGARTWIYGAAIAVVAFVVYAVMNIRRPDRLHGPGQVEQAVGHPIGEPGESRPEEPIGRDKIEKVRRNDPCPCGSGLKFKQCCGAGSR